MFSICNVLNSFVLQMQEHYNLSEDKLESRLYVGNLDLRITE